MPNATQFAIVFGVGVIIWGVGGCNPATPSVGATANVASTSRASAAAVAAAVPNCVDEDSLDVGYDKDLDINCPAVRAALLARRGQDVTDQLRARAVEMRGAMARCCVSRQQLVEHRRPYQGQGLPDDPDELRQADRFSGMLLCDELTREFATRRYIEDHPECIGMGTSSVSGSAGVVQ